MSLRPRYSLLTLLILTAFVAGGAAFWLRPKQVIEQITPNMEVESTYVRNWRGEWIIDGPQVIREYFQGEMYRFHITWFRQGKSEFGWSYHCAIVSEEQARSYQPSPELPVLSPEERRQLRRAIDKEKQRFKPGVITVESEDFAIPVIGFFNTEPGDVPGSVSDRQEPRHPELDALAYAAGFHWMMHA